MGFRKIGRNSEFRTGGRNSGFRTGGRNSESSTKVQNPKNCPKCPGTTLVPSEPIFCGLWGRELPLWFC